MPTNTFFNLPPPKRERLVSAAVAEFVREPYSEVSINRIIRAAEIPRGSFYQYFSDKADLFHYVLERYRQQLSAALLESLEACGGRLMDLPVAMFDRILEQYRADRESFRDLLSIIRQNAGMDTGHLLHFSELRQVLLERVDTANLTPRASGQLELLFRLLILLTKHALMEACCGRGPVEETRRHLEEMVGMLRHGVEEETIC